MIAIIRFYAFIFRSGGGGGGGGALSQQMHVSELVQPPVFVPAELNCSESPSPSLSK